MEISELLKNKILVLDGATGTALQKLSLTEEQFRGERFKNHKKDLKGNYDVLCLSQSEIIKNLHKSYLSVGADILKTNTFNANKFSQIEYDLVDEVYEMNKIGACLAKQAIEEMNLPEAKFIAGSIGPSNKAASISPKIESPSYRDIDFDDVVEAYTPQIEGLMDGGADILLIETVFDTLNAKALLYTCDLVFKAKGRSLPIMISGTITDNSGRTLTGQTVEAFVVSVSHYPLLSIGLNCALGAEQLLPHIRTIKKHCQFYVSVHPNAGLPNEFGAYDQSPELMQDRVKPFLEEGLVNIIGGCCGTTPEHIRKIAELVKK